MRGNKCRSSFVVGGGGGGGGDGGCGGGGGSVFLQSLYFSHMRCPL